MQAAAEEITKDMKDPFAREKEIKAIRMDWYRRERWLPYIVELNKGTLLRESIGRLEEAGSRAWVEHFNSDNPPATRVGALRTIIMSERIKIFTFMKVGLIDVVPEKIYATMTIPGTPFSLDPELKKALLEETARQRQEKARQDAQPAG